ncbi:MAG: MFS transporter [Bacteroidia bacterium]|nr:MFS transporter [Bacteroidia bacterium]
MEKEQKTKKKENPLISILVSIVIPAIILSKFSKPEYLGVLSGFLIALAFPIIQSLYDIIVNKKAGLIAIIGFISIFLTGIIGILELPSQWMAYKEASVPLLIGIAVVVSLKTPYPLIKKLFYNEDLIEVKKIDAILIENNSKEKFEKIMRNATYMIAASFLLSAILNFILTKIIIQSPTGTEAFNEELGKLTALSYPIIALPSTLVMFVALWYLFNQLKKITNLSIEDMMSESLKNKSK